MANLHRAIRSEPRSKRLIGSQIQLRLTTWSIAPIRPTSITFFQAGPAGPIECAGSELTLLGKVTQNSMPQPNSTRATRKNSVNSIAICADACPGYRSSGDAAAPIIDMSSRFAMRACLFHQANRPWWASAGAHVARTRANLRRALGAIC
jgi:hypothetical protein